MNISNIHDVKEWFEILETTERSQSAVMVLTAGGHSFEGMSIHKSSDQILYLVEGELSAEVGDDKRILREGDSCIIPAGTPHRFENQGVYRAVTFNVYSPP